MLNGHASPIIRGNACRVLCDASVELISRFQRPYLFEVTVTGLPPHLATRKYTIAAISDKEAAMAAIKLFVDEFSALTPVLGAL